MTRQSEAGPEDRYDVHVDALMRAPEGSEQIVVMTNFSRRGCRFLALRKLGLGATIAIHAGRGEWIAARVRWRIGMTHGASFDQAIASPLFDHIRLFVSERPALVAERETAGELA